MHTHTYSIYTYYLFASTFVFICCTHHIIYATCLLYNSLSQWLNTVCAGLQSVSSWMGGFKSLSCWISWFKVTLMHMLSDYFLGQAKSKLSQNCNRRCNNKTKKKHSHLTSYIRKHKIYSNIILSIFQSMYSDSGAAFWKKFGIVII